MKTLLLVACLLLLQGKPAVTVNVRVSDALGRSIVGLGAPDFQLWEDGAEQKIDDVRKDEGPATIGIVVDLHPGTGVGDTKAVRDNPVAAALSLLAQADPHDEFFLVTPNSEATVAVDFTSDAAKVARALTSYYRLHGDTGGLTDGVRLGIQHAKAASNSRRFLVVISEGDNGRPRFPAEKEFAKLMAADYVQMFYVAPTPYLDEHPGSYGPEGDRVLAAIRNQYVISYHSTKPQDSKWHDIRVRLKNTKGFREPVDINARPGYYADLR